MRFSASTDGVFANFTKHSNLDLNALFFYQKKCIIYNYV